MGQCGIITLQFISKPPSHNMGNASSRGGGIMKSGASGAQKQSLPLEDALNILLQGFVKGMYWNLN